MLSLTKRIRAGWIHSRIILISALLLLLIIFIYFWHLGSLTPGISSREFFSRDNSQSLTHIIDSGTNAPYHLVQHLLISVHLNQFLSLRLPSIFFMLLILALLFDLLRYWFGKPVALFSVLIFATTPWLVLVSRTGSPDVMFIWPIAILWCFFAMARSAKHAPFYWLLLCSSIAIGIYTPGVVWLILASALITRKPLIQVIKRLKTGWVISGLILSLIIMALLIQAVINDPKILRSVLLIPDQWPTLIELIKNFAWMFVSMFWRTPNHADFNIARLPILNIMELVLIFFGIYALASKKRRITYLLVFFMLTSFLFAAINGSLYILSLALPPIAVFFAAGIRYLYLEWRQVFPINPFAKGLALGLILLVVVSQLLYVGRYSLIAWPHTTDTKNTYVLK